MYHDTEKVLAKRRQAEKAIQLAMANRWDEAISVNKSIIQLYPNDIDAYNRLGKAFMELGKYNDAKRTYKKALQLDSTNQIARKNLERLNVLAKTKEAQEEDAQVDPRLFIEEMGKSATTTLQGVDAKAVANLDAGDRLELVSRNGALAVQTPRGKFVGLLEPKLGRRLARLMEGGNQYAVAVTGVSGNQCRVIIRETYQHPSQVGRPSFPSTVVSEAMRPYTKGRLLRRETPVSELDEEEEAGPAEEREPWEEESELQEGDVNLYDAAEAEELDEELEE